MQRSTFSSRPLVLLLMLLSLIHEYGTRRIHAADSKLTFERDIRPILKANCFHCHGEGEKLRGGVDLRLRRFLLHKTDSGPVIQPGNPSASLLLQVTASGEMPKAEKKLPAEQVAKIEEWIRNGAPTARPEPEEVPRFFITEEEREFWSFQPIQRPKIPRVRAVERATTPVDHFLLEKLETRNLTFAPEAPAHALLRRLYLTLTGLPPTAEEAVQEDFSKDPRIYERLIDRLLDSPAFGERWAVHWLDVAGYSDSNGGPDSDSDRPWAWRYRDYVIRSLNEDKPFDQFIIEQLAGDELVSPPFENLQGADMDRLVATGFLRMAPDPTGDNPAEPELARNQVIADTLQIVSSSLLGLTVQCAQCHDHRYDPIPQTDYYRLRAVFEPAFNWKQWKAPSERSVSLLKNETRKQSDSIESEAARIDKDAQKLHDELIEAFVQRQLKLVPDPLKDPVLQARRTARDKRTDRQKELLREFPTFQDGIILGEIDPDGARKVEAVRKKAAELRARKPADERLHVLVEEPGKNAETFLFHRGDHQQPKEKIQPGGLSILETALPQSIASTNSALRTTGRRLAFAKMLTNGKHPLVARVLVNRIWLNVFGSGIVQSPADFGALGERPTHPELLDWLASEFMAGGWHLKPFLKQLLLSSAFRQGASNPAALEADPDNRLLGRRSLRRMDAETLRDSLLVVSGKWHTGMFGKPVPVAFSAQGQVVVGLQNRDGNGDPTGVGGIGGDEYRRSVYVTAKRTAPVGVMETFDAAIPNPNCEIRTSSTVALQSLLMMNDPFVVNRASDLAERARREAPGRVDRQLERIWLHLFGVQPSGEELKRSLDFLQAQTASISARLQSMPVASASKSTAATASPAPEPTDKLALASLCQALLGSNRFLYME